LWVWPKSRISAPAPFQQTPGLSSRRILEQVLVDAARRTVRWQAERAGLVLKGIEQVLGRQAQVAPLVVTDTAALV
jgi:hypothetical protein